MNTNGKNIMKQYGANFYELAFIYMFYCWFRLFGNYFHRNNKSKYELIQYSSKNSHKK